MANPISRIPTSPTTRAGIPGADEVREGREPCKRFTVALGETPVANPPSAAPAPAAPAGPLSPPAAPGAAQKFVTRLLADERAVDRGLAAAMRGKQFTPQELIVLQAKVIQYSQELEVASRIVEKVTGAVKQTMQTQV